ncbi:hypothetical protein [Nocardioides sp. MH1]|uniref:hypothetical protein n=1 Tax=Nocardioides sp. MH1 TaxID=3242490 RepID=UPI0035225623
MNGVHPRRFVRPLLAVTATAATALTLAGAPPTAQAAQAAPVTVAARTDHSDAGWRVQSLGNGSFAVSWTSPRALPLTSDRPTIVGDGLAFGAPTLGEDGRTVTAVVSADRAPSPSDLDVVLSGDRLDEAGDDATVGAPDDSLGHRVTSELSEDPGKPGDFATVTSDYTWDPVKVAGMKEPIEMVGHVVEPASDAATGPRPLVLFLHGRHSVCYNPDDPNDFGDDSWPCQAPFAEIPSHLGYDYIQQVLASQGYATVSIRVNGINAQDWRLPDGGADARATIVQAHLDRWAAIAADHQVDMDQVVLVGHSRGGEGVDRASIQIPADAPYRIAGQVLLAPTDFAWHTAPYVPTVTVLPYCDGDVYDLQGQRFTDVGRDIAADDTSLKSSVLVMGANHNFFNSEWTPSTAAAPSWDDWGGDKDATCGRKHPDRLSPKEQRSVGTAYVAGAVHLFTGGAAGNDYLPMYDGSPVTVGSIGDAQVLSAAVNGGRDERKPGVDARPTLTTGDAESRLCNGIASWSSSSFAICGRRNEDVTPHWPMEGEKVPTRKFLELSWHAAGATGGLALDEPLDLSTDRLELRTIADPSLASPQVRVRITDSSGSSALLDPAPGTQPRALPEVPGATKLWATTVAVDATGATGVDLTDITAVDLVADSAEGHVWVADVAAAPATLPAQQSQRLPQVRVRTIRVSEGSGGTKIARIPFKIVGKVTRPAQFSVFTAGQQRRQTQRLVVDVAPGQKSGWIPVEYDADRLWGYDQQTQVSLWPMQGVATDDYLGQLFVTDDDPRPTVAVEVPRSVREGGTVRIDVTMSGKSSVDTDLYARTVRTRGENLRGADVPAKWLDRHGDPSHPGWPLWRLYAGVSDQIRAGRTTATIEFPTLDDKAVEGTEYLALRIDLGDGVRHRYRIKVVDND